MVIRHEVVYESHAGGQDIHTKEVSLFGMGVTKPFNHTKQEKVGGKTANYGQYGRHDFCK